jgi:CHAT domain-containing protein
LLTGANGTEAAVKHHIAGKRFVHLATHAFFAPLHKKSMEEAALEQVQTDDSSPQSLNRHQEELAGWLPGLLSGIVFAGANATGDPSASDAILTAEELAWLDLSGCELVTLSACETGLGEPRAGEQLIGLRRALRLAGARTTVTSLWRVDDAATRELMTDFYQRLWLQGQGKAEALRAAQLALLERNRARVGKGLPSTWGAFVLEGDWR